MGKLTKSSVDLRSMRSSSIAPFAPMLLEKLGFGVVVIDAETSQIVYVNEKILSITGYSSKAIIGNLCHSLLCPAEKGKCPIRDLGHNVDNSERQMVCSNGIMISIIKTAVIIEVEGRKYIVESVVDNTERKLIKDTLENEIIKRKELQEKYEYLAYHDYLTGIYNRRFFKEEFSRKKIKDNFLLGIILGDVDGLKVCNDTFGHAEGDKRLKDITNKIRKVIDPKDIFARIGGNEFAVLVTQTSEEKLRGYMDYIAENVNRSTEDGNFSSVSFGYGLQRNENDGIDDLLKEAAHFMHKRKYYNQRSASGNMVRVIMQTLFEKSVREKEHSERVGLFCKAIAQKMGMKKEAVNKIWIAGLLHDIGKIGIEEEILNKPGKLNDKEWEIIKTHTARSARILENTVEYKDLATIVLSHHERYDGKGYPYGLKGEEIPIESRIIAVADSYDAMTQERTYRQTVSKETAIKEIESCSGTQFDPDVVLAFTKKVMTDKTIEA